jgi:xanthine dehydrogenase YagR molybdenum-binding subunit
LLERAVTDARARAGEAIGLAGMAAAITDAVHHATGVRVLELPVKIEHLLTAPPGLFRPV